MANHYLTAYRLALLAICRMQFTVRGTAAGRTGLLAMGGDAALHEDMQQDGCTLMMGIVGLSMYCDAGHTAIAGHARLPGHIMWKSTCRLVVLDWCTLLRNAGHRDKKATSACSCGQAPDLVARGVRALKYMMPASIQCLLICQAPSKRNRSALAKAA